MNIEFNNSNYDDNLKSLEDIDKKESLKIKVNQGLEEALYELNSLKEEYSSLKGDDLIEQCKITVMETVTSQFGLGGILLNDKDGGNVTTTHNFKKGITSNEADKSKYDNYSKNNDGSREWEDVRKATGYDNSLPKMRKNDFQNKDKIIDEYTGKRTTQRWSGTS